MNKEIATYPLWKNHVTANYKSTCIGIMAWLRNWCYKWNNVLSVLLHNYFMAVLQIMKLSTCQVCTNTDCMSILNNSNFHQCCMHLKCIGK